MTIPYLTLAATPTPIVTREALSKRLGVSLFIKRDDATGGAEAGNKIRKLEYLMADALAKNATRVLTCGGIQSNHARATAAACAQLGLRCTLFLRVDDTSAPLPRGGNVFLDKLFGAEIRLISRADYARRNELMAEAASAYSAGGDVAYVVPEGGSSGLGSLGYVRAMHEIRDQITESNGALPSSFDVIAHACGSGGTAAGVSLGAASAKIASRVRAFCVCDDEEYFASVAARIVREAQAIDPTLTHQCPLEFDARGKGPAYAVSSPEQRTFIAAVAKETGLAFDPVYTGKALYGLSLAISRGDIAKGSNVLFVHTGGLPGLLAASEEMWGSL